MLDLHCHLLPGIDDGARSLEMSLEMARVAVADGITVTACTPHIMPGVYDNTGPDIRDRIASLQESLEKENIPLKLVIGADIHVDPAIVAGLRNGRLPTLNGSRYFLLEPPHHVLPLRLEELTFNILSAGYVPVLTHPERLSWIEDHYDIIERLARSGVPQQLTAGSIAGIFGRRITYWCDRMLDEGLVSLIASDGHNLKSRPPVMSKARDIIAARLGDDAAVHLTQTWPKGIVDNLPPETLPNIDGPVAKKSPGGLWAWLESKVLKAL